MSKTSSGSRSAAVTDLLLKLVLCATFMGRQACHALPVGARPGRFSRYCGGFVANRFPPLMGIQLVHDNESSIHRMFFESRA